MSLWVPEALLSMTRPPNLERPDLGPRAEMRVRQSTPDVRGPPSVTEPVCRADREGGGGIISQKEAWVGWGPVPISLSPQGHLPILCQKKALRAGIVRLGGLISYPSQLPCPLCFPHLATGWAHPSVSQPLSTLKLGVGSGGVAWGRRSSCFWSNS